jgi:hypothetical protein
MISWVDNTTGAQATVEDKMSSMDESKNLSHEKRNRKNE